MPRARKNENSDIQNLLGSGAILNSDKDSRQTSFRASRTSDRPAAMKKKAIPNRKPIKKRLCSIPREERTQGFQQVVCLKHSILGHDPDLSRSPRYRATHGYSLLYPSARLAMRNKFWHRKSAQSPSDSPRLREVLTPSPLRSTRFGSRQPSKPFRMPTTSDPPALCAD